MKVVRMTDLPREPAASPLFTGQVFRQSIVDPAESTSFNFSIVNFSAGSRNKFHQHTSDQILIVTEGTGVVASYLGTGMQLTATAWLALDGGAFTVGLVMAARMLPNLLFGLAAGTLADRSDRDRLVVLMRVVALPPVVGLAWLAQTASVNVWALVGLSFLNGCVSVLDVPARQALVIDTVPRDVAPN